MKEFRLFTVLAFSIVLLAFGISYSQTTSGQTSSKRETVIESPFESYAKWRAKILGDQGASIVHYSLSLGTQRLTTNSARIDIVAVGQYPGLDIEIQPIIISSQLEQSLSDGEETKTHQQFPSKSNTLNELVESKIIVPVGFSANALKVKWTVGNEGIMRSNTVIVPLLEKQVVNTFGVVPSRIKKSSQVNILNKAFNSGLIRHALVSNDDEDKCDYNKCPNNCLAATGSNSTCGTYGTCCANYNGNVFDGVNCKVTCGTKCSGCDSLIE